MFRPRHLALLLLLPLPAWLTACAAAPPAANAPASAERQESVVSQQAGYGQPGPQSTAAYPGRGLEIKTLEEMPAEDLPGRLAQFDKAEQALSAALGARDEMVRVDAAKSPSSTVAKGAPAAPMQSDPCLVACAALASMKRSADHVCSMAGEGDAACSGARTRVSRATERVTAACPACALK
ncbi:MAG: hypothetical protein IPK82_29915 [Polyangiaceae bacterium]|nr:hypothetical protein [Polyangiaceae bacterium]